MAAGAVAAAAKDSTSQDKQFMLKTVDFEVGKFLTQAIRLEPDRIV